MKNERQLTYEVHRITTRQEIDTCPTFEVNNVQWRNMRAPRTFGRMAVLENEGIYVTMHSMEEEPLITMYNPMDMVCRDSAMEVFFSFPENSLAADEPFTPRDDSLYFNFEVNAAGALHAKYGHGRRNRTALTIGEYAATGVWASVTPGQGWQMGLLAPYPLLQKTAGISRLAAGDVFFCNFYKISENPGIEHYLSYSPINSDTPNFHLPHCFARAVVV